MAKILTDKELADIVRRAVHEDLIDDSDQYYGFLRGLAELIADHFGSTVGAISYDDCDGLGYTAGFHINECVPDDGGVFKDYDKDVVWKNGEESE